MLAACGGSSSDEGSVNFGAVWERPRPSPTPTAAPGSTPAPTQRPGQNPGDGSFDTELPPSVTTVRIVFESASLRCCVVINPATVPPDSVSGRRFVTIEPLPVGPAAISIAGFPSLTAPAPVGGPFAICPTKPAGVGRACELQSDETPSFTSDPVPVDIEPGGVTDVGEIEVRSVPFVIGRLPSPASSVQSPVALGFVAVDAVSGVDPDSIRAEISEGAGTRSPIGMTLSPCDDRGGEPCSPGRRLQVSGYRAEFPPDALAPGLARLRVRARNLGSPAESVDAQWQFRVLPPDDTPTTTRTVTATPTVTLTRTLTSTPTVTRTFTETLVPTRTATRTPTSIVPTQTRPPTPSPTPTATESRTPSATATRTATASITATASATATPSTTASATITRTSTLTFTPTATPTVTITRTITPTRAPCQKEAFVSACIPATGRATQACALEWVPSAVPTFAANGIPRPRLSCREGDPRCDFGGAPDDGSCTFRVALCINNSDPRTSVCAPSRIDSIEVRKPNPTRFETAADALNAAALEGQAGNGPGGFGVSVLRRGETIFFGRPNGTPNLCGPPLDIIVPMRSTRAGLVPGSRRLRLKVTADSVSTIATIRLTCDETKCGNGVVEDGENCDDGNRLNGDGCDQGCLRELAGSSE